MNKKSTQKQSLKLSPGLSFVDLFGNSIFELFNPSSSRKLINYKDLNLVRWSDLKLVDTKQLNLLNLGVLSLFFQYIGAFTFIFVMVFALPFRIWSDAFLTTRESDNDYAYTQQLIALNKTDSTLSTRAFSTEEINENVVFSDFVAVENSSDFALANADAVSIFTDFEMIENNIADEIFTDFVAIEQDVNNDMAVSESIGYVLGETTVNEIPVQAEQVVVTEDDMLYVSDETQDETSMDMNYNAPETQILQQGSLISMANTVELIATNKTAEIPNNVLGVQDNSTEGFKRTNSCSFTNGNDYYSSGATIDVSKIAGNICFNAVSNADGRFDISFKNLKGESLTINADSNCFPASRIKGLQGSLEVAFDEEYAQCNLVLASL